MPFIAPSSASAPVDCLGPISLMPAAWNARSMNSSGARLFMAS